MKILISAGFAVLLFLIWASQAGWSLMKSFPLFDLNAEVDEKKGDDRGDKEPADRFTDSNIGFTVLMLAVLALWGIMKAVSFFVDSVAENTSGLPPEDSTYEDKAELAARQMSG